MNFLAELRRRNDIRMAGLSLVGAWLLTQVASTLLPVFEAAGWVMKVLFGLLEIGFLVALRFSWVFELTREASSAMAIPQRANRLHRKVGFTELWKHYGPLALCRKDAGGDYRRE